MRNRRHVGRICFPVGERHCRTDTGERLRPVWQAAGDGRAGEQRGRQHAAKLADAAADVARRSHVEHAHGIERDRAVVRRAGAYPREAESRADVPTTRRAIRACTKETIDGGVIGRMQRERIRFDAAAIEQLQRARRAPQIADGEEAVPRTAAARRRDERASVCRRATGRQVAQRVERKVPEAVGGDVFRVAVESTVGGELHAMRGAPRWIQLHFARCLPRPLAHVRLHTAVPAEAKSAYAARAVGEAGRHENVALREGEIRRGALARERKRTARLR